MAVTQNVGIVMARDILMLRIKLALFIFLVIVLLDTIYN